MMNFLNSPHDLILRQLGLPSIAPPPQAEDPNAIMEQSGFPQRQRAKDSDKSAFAQLLKLFGGF